MKIINKLPEGCIAYAYNYKEDCFYSNLGLKFNIEPTNNNFFVRIQDWDMVLFHVNYEIEDDVISFIPEEVERIHYNVQYNEMEYVEEKIFQRFLRYASFDDYQTYLAKIMNEQEDEFFKEFCFNNKETVINMFKLFCAGANKNIPLFLKEGLSINVLFKTEYKQLNNIYTKREIQLAKSVNISPYLAKELLKKFNFSELEKFKEVLVYFNINPIQIFNSLDKIDDISKFATYFLKSIFLYDNIHIEKVGKYSYEKSPANFMQTYNDYLLLIADDEQKDLYPENLLSAHDAAVDRLTMREQEKEYERYNEYIESFFRETSKYLELKFEDGDFKVEIPRKPCDLVKESEALHHCVKTYIYAVAEGNTQICLIRKNDAPYMTIEIKDSAIVQAKKKYNHYPNEDDEKFLEKWCEEKGLIIGSY